MKKLIAGTSYSMEQFNNVPGKTLVGYQRVKPTGYSDRFQYGMFLAENGMNLTKKESQSIDRILNRIYHITGKWKHMPVTGLADWLNKNLPESKVLEKKEQENYLFHMEGLENIPVFFSYWPDDPSMDYPIRIYVYRDNKEEQK